MNIRLTVAMMFPPATDIHEIRKKLGITQSDLSAMSGVSQSTIAKIESGKVSGSYETVVKLFTALNAASNEDSPTAGDICSRNVESVTSSDMIHVVSGKMRSTGYSQFPVFEDGKPVGSISERDIFKLLDKGMTMEELSRTPVSHIMAGPYAVIRSDASIFEVTVLMKTRNAILVSEDGVVIGMITNADLLKLI